MRCSVVMAAFQREATVGRALVSVLAQTRAPDEVIVVDDGSTDRTAEVVRGFSPDVQLVSQENSERGAARNVGVARATGDVIAFIDSDDQWLPGHLDSLLPAFDGDDVVVAHTQAQMFDDVRRMTFFTSGGGPTSVRFRDIILGNPVPFSASGVRRGPFDEVGGFEVSRTLSGVEDWDLWIRLAAIGRIRSLDPVTARIHFHPGNTVGDVDRQHRALEALRTRTLAHPRVIDESLEDAVVLGSVLRMARIRREAGQPARALRLLAGQLSQRPRLLRASAAWRGITGAALDAVGLGR